ncbi:MAG: indole-3-glycerol phosphate synthase TrpC, partial [Eubacterium sp.]|nr:indole-3-glycerol phosphate synthase TrpC [Eubacterium sp.]
ILDEIAGKTRLRLEKEKKEVPLDVVMEQAEKRKPAPGAERFPFEKELCSPGISFICEVKKASPSKGLIAGDFDYRGIAREYEAAGAAAISVLTEPDYFLGDIRYLREISEEAAVPLLRKDFVIDEYMIYEAKANGASIVLLICSLLKEDVLRRYMEICDSLGMSALTEVHDENEIQKALSAGARIIGVNNRNLQDFSVDVHNGIRLREKVPEDILFVAESGIRTRQDIVELEQGNVNGVLIGETLMRSEDKKRMLDELKGGL